MSAVDRVDEQTGDLLRADAAALLQTQVADEDGADPFRLARAYADQERTADGVLRVRYWRSEWFSYRDGRFVRQDEGAMRVRLTGFVKRFFDGNDVTDREGNTRRVTRALVSNVLNALAAVVAAGDDLEQPVWLGGGGPYQFIALKNGLLDVAKLHARSVPVQPNSPKWFSTVALPYDYVPGAPCAQWLRFLDQVMEADAERVALLQEWAGYLLTPDTSHHKFMVVEGEGANGKSVLLEVLTALLGPGNVSQVPLERFGDRFQLTPTIDKLANICAEVGEINSVAEGVLKQFTAGDRMYFDRKGIPGVERYPTARLILATNSRPRFKDRSMGVWRRMLLVPFRYTVPAEFQDRDLTKRLKAELPGIFLWALAGLKRLRQQGHFTDPATCRAALEEYRLESNPARVFVNEQLVTRANHSIPCQELYAEYVTWSNSNGFDALDAAQFGKELRKLLPSVQRRRGSGVLGRGWRYFGVSRLAQ